MENKKSLVALALVALVGLVGGTFAYFTSSTTLTNEFETGTYSTSITEEFVSPDNWTPGTTTKKRVNVTNNGSVEVAVRAKYTEKWTAKDGTVLSGTRNEESVAQFKINPNWIKANDGYYYYNDTLIANETSSDFISSVTFNPNFILEEGTDIECTTTKENGKTTVNCANLESGYAGATYSLEITIETIQASQGWNYELSEYTGGVSSIKAEDFIDNQIYVSNGEDLAGALKYINSLDGTNNETYTISLLSDINLNGAEWGKYVINENVVIEGNGNTIYDMSASHGLISRTLNGKNLNVKNLNFENGSVIDNGGNTLGVAGVIVGNAYGTVTIENVSIDGLTIKTNIGGYSGGFVGYTTQSIMVSDSSVMNCNIGGVDVNVSNKTTGGIVGFTYSSVDVNNTKIIGNTINNIQGTYDKATYAGSIVGRLSGGTLKITDVVTENNVYTDGSMVDVYTSKNSTGTITVN